MFRTRLFGIGLVVVGLLHVLVPGRLLATASVGYDRALAVDFDPRDGTTRRVRALGVLFLAAGAHLLYHGRVLPDRG